MSIDRHADYTCGGSHATMKTRSMLMMMRWLLLIVVNFVCCDSVIVVVYIGLAAIAVILISRPE